MRILLVTQAYPPINVGGTMRALRWSNYLASIGHDISVLCLDPAQQNLPIDHGLVEEIDERIDVRRVVRKRRILRHSIDSGYLFTTDSFWHDWKDEFEEQLRRSIGESGVPDVVIITCPPFSLYRAQKIVRRHTNARILLDLRDAWSLWVVTPYPSYLHYRLTRRRERKAIAAADLVSVTSPTTRRELIGAHGLDEKKIHVIENTFDDYASSRGHLAGRKEEIASKGSISISYIGSFYYNPYSQSLIDRNWYRKKPYQYLQYVPRVENWLYRSPYFIFSVFDRLFARYPEYRTRVRIRFVGNKPDWWHQMLSKFALSGSIDHVGLQSREDTIAIQNDSDFLLITSSKREGGKDYSIAGKTFDYLASGRGIIGLVTDGDQKDVLDASGMALCLDSDDIDGAVDRLHELLSGRLVLNPNREFIDQYRTRNKLETLRRLLLDLAQRQEATS